VCKNVRGMDVARCQGVQPSAEVAWPAYVIWPREGTSPWSRISTPTSKCGRGGADA
jgi:hypothetical protein